MAGRDIIVIGTSAGGVEALQRLVRDLPADLPAAVLIVLHRPAHHESLLPDILRRAGRLPAANARDGEAIRRGQIYVAPPDLHLLIENGVVRLVRGPKENHSRPAIDPLFRSAAQEFGPRVVGVILSGTLYDGTAGLFAVKRRSGVAVVQDPEEAAFPGMPESAISNVTVDHILPLSEIAPTLARLAREPVEKGAAPIMPNEFEQMPEIVEQDRAEQVQGERHARTSIFVCPECGGTLWQAESGPLLQFRCHVGHAYTGNGLVEMQSQVLENSLWFAVRTMIDKSLLLRQLAQSARQRGDAGMAEQLDREAGQTDQHAAVLRRIVESPGAAITEGGGMGVVGPTSSA